MASIPFALSIMKCMWIFWKHNLDAETLHRTAIDAVSALIWKTGVEELIWEGEGN